MEVVSVGDEEEGQIYDSIGYQIVVETVSYHEDDNKANYHRPEEPVVGDKPAKEHG